MDLYLLIRLLLPYCDADMLSKIRSLDKVCCVLAEPSWTNEILDHPFNKGRIYQLIRDKYGEPLEGRHYSIESTIEDELPTDEQRKAWALNYRGKKWLNNWDSFRTETSTKFLARVRDLKLDSLFYYGRCVQFLLDSNHKRSFCADDLQPDLVEEAHYHWERIIMPKRGERMDFDQCDDCSKYYVGDRRCSCGNRRVEIVRRYGYEIDLDSTRNGWTTEAY